jgi:hypothetical protein
MADGMLTGNTDDGVHFTALVSNGTGHLPAMVAKDTELLSAK